jgi:TatD DNase family protein
MARDPLDAAASRPPEFIDTHAHLDDGAFEDGLADVLERAAAVGVRRVVNIGYRPARWDSTTRLARDRTEVSVALGLHPQHADEFDDRTIEVLDARIRTTGAIAVGEIGLDYFRGGPAPATQRRAFEAQLALAGRLGRPVVIHQRAAEADCAAILAELPAGRRVVLHSFDGTDRLAGLARERGWVLGVGGLMTRAGNGGLREILGAFPLGQLVLETDAPYLTPAGVKARRNEPSNLPGVAARLAELHRCTVEEIARATTANAERTFGLPTATREPTAEVT